MRAANANLIAFLNSRASYTVADLYKFTLADGTILTFTSYDQTISLGGYVYSALGPLIDRTKWGIKNTPDVPEMDILILTNGADMPDGSNIKLSVHNGLFNFATVLLSRLFMPTPGNTSLGALDIFLGNVSDVEIDALSVKVTVKGANTVLGQYMPRNTFNQSCIHNLFDKGCAPDPGQPGGGPAKADFTVTSSVGAGSTRGVIVWPAIVPPNPTNFNYGWIEFTNGVNEGSQRSIAIAGAESFTLIPPLYQMPSPGDTFKAVYGCSKTRTSTGCLFFGAPGVGNLQHFLGFPYIPPATYGF